MYKFTKVKQIYGNLIFVEKDNEIILKTFVNYSENWFDIEQPKKYWFSRLIFQNLDFDEFIYANRTEYFLDGKKVTCISSLKKNISQINELIFSNFPNLIDFIDSNKKTSYYEIL